MDMVITPAFAATALPTGDLVTGGVEVIDKLESEWRALCEQGPYDQPFHRPEWLRAYVQAFARDKDLLIATARLDGRLIGILPLIRRIGLVRGVPARQLTSTDNPHACRFDLVHSSAHAGEAIAAIWRSLAGASGWDVLQLVNVPYRGAAARLARLAQAEGWRVRAARAPSSPYVSLERGANAFQGMLERLDAKFRANLRRRWRKLEAKGELRLHCSRTVDERLARFYALERAGWKGAEGSAVACDPDTMRFYDQVAREAARAGYFSLHALECAGEPVAMSYGLTHRGRYYVLKTAFDEAVRDCSPGQLITQEVFRDLGSRQCTEFDFLGINMDWKQDWMPRQRPHANWYVFRGAAGAAVEALGFAARPALARGLKRFR